MKKNKHQGSSFQDHLKEQLQDPAFAAEYWEIQAKELAQMIDSILDNTEHMYSPDRKKAEELLATILPERLE